MTDTHVPAPAATIDPRAAHGPRKATAFQLVFMTYAIICSGAYGLEEMVSISGPGLAMLLLLVLPVLYGAPLALTCAELTARFPVEGGYYRWVRRAFGEGLGYTAGWLMWIAMFATNASFAVLFSNYLRYFIPDLSPAASIAASSAVVWLAVWLNYRGIRLVGSTSVLVTILIAMPFGIMTVLGFWQWRYSPVEPFVAPDAPFPAALAGGVLIAMWLYGGFEKITVAAEEVEDPVRAFPRALALALPLCAASYILPTLAALAANGDWQAWEASHYMTAAARIGGPWLGAAMAAGALVSNAGILTATILSQSRLPPVLADDGLFPRAFARRHPRFGTPVLSLIVTGVVISLLSVLPFAQLAGAAALVQSLSYLLIYATLFKLRRQPAAVGAPGFRLPLGTTGLVLMVAPTVAIVLLVVQQGLFPDGRFDVGQALVGLLLFGSGPATYALARPRRRAALPADRVLTRP